MFSRMCRRLLWCLPAVDPAAPLPRPTISRRCARGAFKPAVGRALIALRAARLIRHVGAQLGGSRCGSTLQVAGGASDSMGLASTSPSASVPKVSFCFARPRPQDLMHVLLPVGVARASLSPIDPSLTSAIEIAGRRYRWLVVLLTAWASRLHHPWPVCQRCAFVLPANALNI